MTPSAPAATPQRRSAGQALVDQLSLNGITHAFGVPGESYLAVLDALVSSPINWISTRHEAAAANMAEAYGKLTGRPGVCLVTRGPGATQASVGVHTASQDSTPMLLLVGQVARSKSGREGFQEVDQVAFFRPLAKWSVQIDDAQRVPEIMAHAISVASSGRPGPVVVALPEDMLEESVEVENVPATTVARAAPSESALKHLWELMEQARSPVILLGESGWSATASSDLARFARSAHIPVATAFRCQDHLDNRDHVYAGHLGLGTDAALTRLVAEADLLIAVGGRLDEITTGGYGWLSPPRPKQTLVHVHPDPDQLGQVFQPDLAIVSGGPEFAAALAARTPPSARPELKERLVEAHSDFLNSLRIDDRETSGLDLAPAMEVLRRRLPQEAIITSGAGNFSLWAHRFLTFSQYPTQLAPRSGSMGYGFPAALCAKALHGERPVVCITGDGDFQMATPELATAVQYGLNVIVLVVNNGMFGTIRMHQERRYPGRPIGTDLRNPDFAALARAYGAVGVTALDLEQFDGALSAALEQTLPTVIDVRVDPNLITPRQTLEELGAGGPRVELHAVPERAPALAGNQDPQGRPR